MSGNFPNLARDINLEIQKDEQLITGETQINPQQ
jgi:hypothetical protein